MSEFVHPVDAAREGDNLDAAPAILPSPLPESLLEQFRSTARALDAAQKTLRAAQLAHAESIKLLSEEAVK